MSFRKTALCLLLCLLAALPAACGISREETPQEAVTDALGISADGGMLLSHSDSHGGFHGDGMAFTALSFSDSTFQDAIQADPAWQPLPLSDSLTILAYGKTDGTFSAGPYLTEGNTQAPLFPRVENGFYYFLGRHSQSTDPRDDSNVLDRASFNLTLAIYNTDDGCLYCCVFDT